MLTNWIAGSLNRKLVFGLAAILAVSSLVFLALFVRMYQDQLADEYATASSQVNLLLQASLENAMLNRDLSGLNRIVRRLGRQEHINRVMILSPEYEVRFSSSAGLLHKKLTLQDISGCTDCSGSELKPGEISHFLINQSGREVLRSINPIANKRPCRVCHGAIEDSPVNGVMIIDYEAAGLHYQAIMGAAGLAGAGGLVVLLSLLGAWLFLNRAVITPVQALNRAAHQLSAGNMEARVACVGRDEMSVLCCEFNQMAQRLSDSLNKLKSNEEFLQSMIDAVPDGIRVIDSDFKVLLANNAYKEQTGLGDQCAIGQFCYRSTHGRKEPCPPTLITCPVHEINKARKPLKIRHRHTLPDGRELPVEIFAAPLVLQRDGREELCVVEAIRDLESQARISQEQRLSELGQLATGVAHEIHNPLASVRLGLQALLQSAQAGSSLDDTLEYLRQVDGEIDKCIVVTRRLLDISMPPSEYEQLIDLTPLAHDIVSLLRYESIKKKVTTSVDMETGVLRVLATDSEMRMLLLNLMQNAFHAMPDGGTLEMKGVIEGDWVAVSLTDSGVGILPEDLKYIFDPFFSRRADDVAGTGLGLTMCRAITDRYGGSLKVISKRGVGSTFTVTLPAADRAGDI